ncbi:MAG: restriction endonuclease subunit S, partial [Synergistaceae bacterium]|nr:restriction endonuclease subunit S [Synergistaceae bacterium]
MGEDLTLDGVKWGEFILSELFDVSLPSGDIQADKCDDGESALLSAGFNNNGICKFIKCYDERANLYSGNVISVDMFGKAFFHGYEFYAVSHGRINILKPRRAMNQYHLHFIVTAISYSVKGKFSYNQMCSSKRVKSLIIQLPVDESGQPDYAFMERYMRNIEQRLIKSYVEQVSVRLRNTPPQKLLSLNGVTWKGFRISDVFVISPGKRLRKEDMSAGDKPFIGASDSNNGVTAFVSNSNSSEDRNILGVNYNGSVVESFYHPYTCLFSDDVKRFRIRDHEGDKYIYEFMKTVILQQKVKYTYGYKFNEQRMQGQTIMLPADSSGLPDWNLMRSYMLAHESRLLSAVINHF